jgi:hypothetical protein
MPTQFSIDLFLLCAVAPWALSAYLPVLSPPATVPNRYYIHIWMTNDMPLVNRKHDPNIPGTNGVHSNVKVIHCNETRIRAEPTPKFRRKLVQDISAMLWRDN